VVQAEVRQQALPLSAVRVPLLALAQVLVAQGRQPVEPKGLLPVRPQLALQAVSAGLRQAVIAQPRGPRLYR
jgi:hypothetical protein